MRAVVLFFLLLFPLRTWGLSPDLFIHASRLSGVPLELLLAISHVESRFNPYALNIGGRSFFPSSRAEAERVLRKSGDSVDIGLMQVNYGLWGKRFGLSKADLLDPDLNVLVGAKILSRHVRKSQDWREGIGSYHSPTPQRQKEYVEKVFQSYSRILSRVRN